MREHSSEQARRRAAPGPWFLSAALGLLVAAGAFTYVSRRGAAPYAPPAAGDPEQPVQVWRGELLLGDGGRLTAEVAPLHADAGRQAFEAESLRRKFARSDGEPWRVRLRREPAAGEGASPERVQVTVGLAGFSLRDARGLAAGALELPAVDGALQDPVWSLFRAPEGGLGPAQAVDFVLWGRAPEPRAELRGGAWGEAPDAALAIELAPAPIARAQLERPFTHHTRGDEVARAGKTSAAGASERRPRARTASDG